MADALGRRTSLLATLRVKVVGFDLFPEMYVDNANSRKIWADVQDGLHSDYMIHDGFLFRGLQLCIPNCSLRDHIIMELHARGLASHFGRDKTIAMVEESYYWPKLRHDVAKFVERCRTC